jgi:hypothetical protein
MMRTVSAYVFVVAASVSGCAPTGDVEYAGEVHVTSPELVTISPGVQVVADADEPLFYSDGMYWLYRDNSWYRSDSYRGGFARVEYTYLPQRIRVIERPQTYVQYRRHGEGRYARERQMQTRSQQSQSPATSIPSQPDTYRPGDAHPTPRPEGINPNQPSAATPPAPHPTTTPPAVVSPNNPSAPAPGDQRFQQPIDRANPRAKAPIGNPAPGVRPDDRTNPHPPINGASAPPRPDDRGPGDRNPPGPDHDMNGHGHGNGNPSAPSRIAPNAPTDSPASPNTGAMKDADKDKHEHVAPPGQADKADREAGKKADEKHDKKKNEKY